MLWSWPSFFGSLFFSFLDGFLQSLSPSSDPDRQELECWRSSMVVFSSTKILSISMISVLNNNNFLFCKMFRPGILLPFFYSTLCLGYFDYFLPCSSIVASLCFQAFLRKSILFFVNKSSNIGRCLSFIDSRLFKLSCKVSHSPQA